MRRALLRLAAVASLVAPAPVGAAAEDPTDFTPAQAREFFAYHERLDQEKVGLFRRLQAAYPGALRYKASEVKSILYPPEAVAVAVRRQKAEPRSAPVPAGATPKKEALAFLERERAVKGGPDDPAALLVDYYGDRPWYRRGEVIDVVENGSGDYKLKTAAALKPRPLAGDRATGWRPIPNPLDNFRLRAGWSDVLLDEDRSLGDAAVQAEDLTGAKFSFAWDRRKGENTWNAVGALIYPITYLGSDHWPKGGMPFTLSWFSLAPSVSINRVSTSGDPEGEVDQFIYRLGLYSKFLIGGMQGVKGSLIVRAAGVYLTNTGHRDRVPGFELEAEPIFLFSKNAWLGADNVIVGKEPRPDGSDNALVAFRLRLWLHAEGGRLQRSETDFLTAEKSFLRAGPAVQARLNFPDVFRGLSFTAQYQYLAPIEGTSRRPSLLTLSSSLALYKENTGALQRSISLTADYTRGGLLFTKQPVDSVKVGLSIVY